MNCVNIIQQTTLTAALLCNLIINKSFFFLSSTGSLRGGKRAGPDFCLTHDVQGLQTWPDYRLGLRVPAFCPAAGCLRG